MNAVDRGRRGLLAMTVLSAAGAAHAAPDEPMPAAATREWIRALHAWALPRYEHLLASAESLLQAIGTPSDGAATLAEAEMQSAWVRTMHAWRQLEALQLGPTLMRRSSRKLDFWPTRPASIEQTVQSSGGVPAEGAEAERWLSRLGVAVKGLPALEYLLFAEAGALPLRRSPAHGLYARRITREVIVEARTLRDAWAAETMRWEQAPAAEVQRALHDVLNLLVGSCELLRGKKLQKASRSVALGGRDAALTNAFDSVRSSQTRSFLLVHLEAVLQLMLGQLAPGLSSAQAPSMSLADLLNRRGAGELAQSLVAPAALAHQAALALPAAPQQWTLARVEPLANALRDLRSQIDPPIAALLGVTITFTDADGD